MYPLGTWFVPGICVWLPCIKETMMMTIIIIIIIIIIIKLLKLEQWHKKGRHNHIKEKIEESLKTKWESK